MIHSVACTALVARFEGFRSRPYMDQGGVWTVGFGDTEGVTEQTPPQTQIYAFGRLDINLHTADEALENLVKVPLQQYEWDALASLVFNIGYGHLAQSDLLKMLNTNADRIAIGNKFLEYDEVRHKQNNGLLNRRKAERAMFLALPETA